MMQRHTLQPKKKMKRDLFIYLSASKARKGKYRQEKNQEKQFWLKAQITKNQIKESHNGNCKNNDSHACLKTIIFIFFIFFCQLLTEKKQAKGKMNPKLLIVQT
jgi:hypothetical protein